MPAANPLSAGNNDTARALRNFPTEVDEYHQTRRDKYNKRHAEELEREEAKAAAANVNVQELRKLDCKARYAGELITQVVNRKHHFVYVHDPEGRLARVDVAEAVRASDDFLEELANGSFGFVYRTKARADKPSTVRKVYKPVYRQAASLEYNYLSKFRYFDFFASTTNRPLGMLSLGGDMRCECLEMCDNPELKSLDVRRKAIDKCGPALCDPECETYYTVAFADIAMGLQYLHAAGIIHGNLKVWEFVLLSDLFHIAMHRYECLYSYSRATFCLTLSVTRDYATLWRRPRLGSAIHSLARQST